MCVDESRCQHQTVGIDHRVRCRRLEVPKGGNTLPYDANVHIPGGAAAAIDYSCIDDYHSSGLGLELGLRHISAASCQQKYDNRQYRQNSIDHPLSLLSNTTANHVVLH